VHSQNVGSQLIDSRLNTQKVSSIGFLLLENFSEVISDLGIPIRPDTPLTEIRISDLDLMVVCRGLRTPRTVQHWLISLLHTLASLPIALGGLWTGARHFVKVGLLETLDTIVVDRDGLTAPTPAGVFQVMIQWLHKAANQ
jgi:transcriptional regulator GlxA family with amidase domain